METIRLYTINLKNLKRISRFSAEADLYSDYRTVYKVFKDDVDFKVKEAKVEALHSVVAEGLVLPKQKIVCGDFIGYSMDFVKGKYITDLKLDINQLINLFKKLSSLLKMYHNLGIVLGDLNFTNILVKSLEEVYFCDVDSCKILNYNINCIPFLTYDYLQSVGLSNKISIDKNLDNLSLYLLFLYMLFNKKSVLHISPKRIEEQLEKYGLQEQKEMVKMLKIKFTEIPYFEEML